jgi:histidinol-phosphatase (PHP family)
MARDDFDDWRMRLGELGAYVESVERVRRDEPELVVRLGLEVDYLPGEEDWVRELAGRYEWDYFIGSVHYIEEGWDVDNPNKIARWRGRDADEVWGLYFERLIRAIESGLFDIVGHADLAKKFGYRPRGDCGVWHRRVATASRKAGVAIELNTAGLRKDCREIYPSRQLLEVAQGEGVPIAFGSDAHVPEDVGADFVAAVELARTVGYRHWCRWEGRKRVSVEL